MDQGWRRFHLLLVFLTFWKHVIGHASLGSQYVNPRSLRYQKTSPRGFEFNAITGNAPLEAGPNVLAVESPTSSQILSQLVGGASSSYKSTSQTQSSPSDSVSASWSLPQNLPEFNSPSLLQLQGSSSSSPQGMASQSGGGQGSYGYYDFTYKDRTGLQPGGSGQLVSTQGGSSFSQAVPDSFSELNMASLDVVGQSSGDESLSTASSQSALGGISSQLFSQGSGASHSLGTSGQQAPTSPAHAKLLSSSERVSSQVTGMHVFPSQYTSVSQDPSRLKWLGSSGQFVAAQGGSASLGGLSAQSQSTSSQHAPAYSSSGFSPIATFSPSTSKTSQFLSSSMAQGVSSRPIQPAFGSPQYVSAPIAAAQSPSQYNQASVPSLSQSQIPQRWQSSSFSQGSQTSGVAVSQSRFSVPSKSPASVGGLIQSAPALVYSSASMPSTQSGYSQATDSTLSLSQNQAPQRWQPSVASFFQGGQTSGAALSQSRFSAPSAPSKSFLSVGGPSAYASLYSSASMPSPQSGYSQATDSTLSQSQAPQRWQPSVSSFSQGSQTSGSGLSQSRFSVPSKSPASVGGPSQSAPASVFSSASLPSPQSGYSQYSHATDSTLSQSQAPKRWQSSLSSFSQGSQNSGSVLSQSSFFSPSKSPASGGPSQSAPASVFSSASLPSPQSGYSQYSHATDSTLSQSQAPQRWQPSVSSFSQGSQTSGVALSQSSFSAPSAPAPSKSFLSVGGQSASASPQSGYSHVSQATDSSLSLSQSQAPQRWQHSTPLSSGFETSSTVVSQSSPAQSAKVPSRFFLASGSGPSQLGSTQGASSYGGLAQSPSSSPLYAPTYSQIVSSPAVSSQFASGQSLYTSSSPSLADTALGASSRYAAALRGPGFNIGSLQPQVAAGQHVPASFGVKVPAYSQATPSISSMSPSLQSSYTWQSTTSTGGDSSFPTSGAAVLLSSSSPQSVQGSSSSSQEGKPTSRLLYTPSRGSFSFLSPSVSAVRQYTPGTPAYAKFGTSPLGVSSQYLPLATTGAAGQLTSSRDYLFAQGGSSSSVGSSVLSQGVLTKDVIAPLDSQTAAVSSGVQPSGTAAFQSGSSQSSQASSSLFSLPSLSSNVDSGAVSSQMSPGLTSGNPTGFMTPTSGSPVQAASGVFSASSQPQTLTGSASFGLSEGQGMSGSSSMSSGSAPVLSGNYDSSISQGASVFKPSQGSLSRYYGVKS